MFALLGQLHKHPGQLCNVSCKNASQSGQNTLLHSGHWKRNIASPASSLSSVVDPLVVGLSLLAVASFFNGLHPITLRQPKQHLSQSAEFAMMDGPMLIIFCVVCCESFTTCDDDDDTTKFAIFEEEIDDGGVNAEEDNIGRASNPFFPFVILPLSTSISVISPLSFFVLLLLLITSASSNSSKGLTGNK